MKLYSFSTMTRYEIQKLLHVDQHQKNKVDTAVQDCIFMAEELFGKGVVIPEVRYDLVGKAAGQAVYDRSRWGNPIHLIRVNPVFLNENEEYIINQTVPHEMAHVVVNQFYKDRGISVRGHGEEWKRVMRHFGLPPNRCHSLDVSTIRALRGGVEYHFECGCVGQVYKLTKNKYTRWANGCSYRCLKCGNQIRFDKKVEL